MNDDPSSTRFGHLRRSPWVVAGASALIPGTGHLALGLRRRAIGLLSVSLAGVVVLGIAVTWFLLDLIKLWLIPTALIWILVVNAVGLVFRSAATLDAYSRAGGKAPGLRGLVPVAALVLVLAVPHALVGYLAYSQYDLVTTVFAPPVAQPPPTTAPPVVTGPSTTPPVTTTVPTTTTTTVPVLWDGLERLNVVLLGADAGVGRRGLRTDTTIVVSIDPTTGDAVMVSVPRDFSNAPLPDGMGIWDCNCFPDLITHLYDAAVRRPEAFPGPGEPPINAIKGALGELFGIEIHYYAMVDLKGFVAMVDSLGGVTINVPKTIVDNNYPHEDGYSERIVIEEGLQHLDGHLALAYARTRRQSDDFGRIHRQRCVIGALIDQTSPVEIIARYAALAAAAKDHLSTDIPQDRLVDFVELVPLVDVERIATLRITRPVYQTGVAPGRIYYDIERIREDAQQLMNDPAAAQERLGLDPLDETCTESYD